MIFSVGAFFVAAQVCSGTGSERLKKIVLGGWVSGLFLISIYGILQKTGGIGPVQVPQMDRVFGTFGNTSAPVEETIFFSSISIPGSETTSEPVAMTIYFVS